MTKKNNNICLKILGSFFIIFMALYIANQSGYYESKIKDNTIMTDKEIKDFELKVKNGEKIDLSSYMKNNRVDYSSKVSRLGDNITSKLEGFISESAKYVSKVIKTLF